MLDLSTSFSTPESRSYLNASSLKHLVERHHNRKGKRLPVLWLFPLYNFHMTYFILADWHLLIPNRLKWFQLNCREGISQILWGTEDERYEITLNLIWQCYTPFLLRVGWVRMTKESQSTPHCQFAPQQWKWKQWFICVGALAYAGVTESSPVKTLSQTNAWFAF